MKRNWRLWGVYTPEGRLISVEPTEFDGKVCVFSQHDREFQAKHWHKETPAWKAAKKEGWRIREGYFKLKTKK